MNKPALLFSLTLPVICFSAALQAEATKGQFGLGATMTNRFSVYDSYDNNIEIHPHLQYRGERFNILENTMSYNFSNNPDMRMELIGKLENRGHEADTLDAFRGMEDRDPGFGAGGRFALRTDLGMFRVDATSDISGTHKGQVVDASFGPDIYQQHWNGQKELSVNMLAGVKWESDEVVNHYYGVRDSESTASRAAYQGEAALTPYVGLNGSVAFSPNVTLDANVIYQKLPQEIANSPLVDDDQTVEVGVGLTYWFD